MNFRQLWKKMFSKRNEEEDIALHVAGATVRHRHPFEDVDVPRNNEDLSREFIDKWVVPFYMVNLPTYDSKIKEFAASSNEITIDIVKKLLGDFNFRPRISAAYFAAINNYKELDDIIGRHLIKSEVAYAGFGYCLALATFATDRSKGYLMTYLDYYLDRKDLYFDQSSAFCALEYLDNESATNLVNKWNSFISDKPYWNLDKSRKYFTDSMSSLEKIRQAKN